MITRVPIDVVSAIIAALMLISIVVVAHVVDGHSNQLPKAHNKANGNKTLSVLGDLYILQ